MSGLNKENTASNIIETNWTNNNNNNNLSLRITSWSNKIIYASLGHFQSKEFKSVGKVVSIIDESSIKTGVITKVNKQSIKIYSSETLTNPSEIKIKDWWNIGVAFIYLVSSEALIDDNNKNSILEINFDVPRGTPKFTIKWSLYYSFEQSDYKEIIKGTDWERVGYSKVTLNNYLWKEGTYKISAKRLSLNRSTVVNTNFKEFFIKSGDTILISPLESIKL